jgi:hypothetical protein
MSNLSDSKSSGIGLVLIRENYIRRAELLIDDQDEVFAQYIRAARFTWNDSNPPKNRIQRASDVNEHWPVRLINDLVQSMRTPPQTPRRLEEFEEDWNACQKWAFTVDLCRSLFFPFNPVSSSRMRNAPGTRFICAAIAADHVTDLKGHVEDCFPDSEFWLAAEPAAPSLHILQAIADPRLIPTVLSRGMTMPMFPDVNPHDLDKAGMSVAAQTNATLHHQTVDGIAADLESIGTPQKEISSLLGMSPDTLKSRRRRRRPRV